MERVNAALESLRCRHFLLILDCCFAGAFRWANASTRNIYHVPRTLYQEHFEQYTRDSAWQAITSTASDQEALDVLVGKSLGSRRAGDNQHSPFAQALLDALSPSLQIKNRADTNDDNVVLATEL